jgi:hypothetical protein
MKMMLKINGVDFMPFIAKQGVKWQRNDIDAPNSGRTMDGMMQRGRVATKIRLDITCRPLMAEEARQVPLCSLQTACPRGNQIPGLRCLPE